jgi:hypothetical protein
VPIVIFLSLDAVPTDKLMYTLNGILYDVCERRTDKVCDLSLRYSPSTS